MKIRSKLFLLLTALSLVPLVVLGAVSYTIARGAVLDSAQEQLTKVRDELAFATTRNVERAGRIGADVAKDQNFVLYLTYLGSKDVRFLEPIMKKVLGYHLGRDPRILAITVRFPGSPPIAAMRRQVELPGDLAASGEATPSVVPIGEDAFCITVPAEAGPNKGTVHVVVAREWLTVEIDAAAVAADRPVAGFLVSGGRLHGASAGLNEAMLAEPFADQPWVTFDDRVAAVGPVAGTPFYVGASMAESEFLAPARFVRNASLALILLVAALVVVASLGFATTIVKPIAAMVAVARKVAGGDLDARVASRRADELGDLGRDFDAMTIRLKATIGDLDRRVRELTTLYEASTVINQSEDLKEVLALSGELLASGFGVTRSVFLKAEESPGNSGAAAGRFVPVHWQGKEPAGLAIAADHAAVRRAFASRSAVSVAGFREDAGLKATIPSAILDELKLFVVVPILASKREVGLILVLDAAEEPDEEDRRLFAVLSSLIAPLFVTAGPARSKVLYEGLREDLGKLLERVDRMDSRCTGATVTVSGDPVEASRVTERLHPLMSTESAHVYRTAPATLLAFFPGLSPLEVEASLTRLIAEKEPAAGFTVRAASYPDDAESATELIARCLAAK